MANEQADWGMAYDDLLGPANKMDSRIVRLEARVKALEHRAVREDSNAEMERMGKITGQMAQDGK